MKKSHLNQLSFVVIALLGLSFTKTQAYDGLFKNAKNKQTQAGVGVYHPSWYYSKQAIQFPNNWDVQIQPEVSGQHSMKKHSADTDLEYDSPRRRILGFRYAPIQNYGKYRMGSPVEGLTSGKIESNLFRYRYTVPFLPQQGYEPRPYDRCEILRQMRPPLSPEPEYSADEEMKEIPKAGEPSRFPNLDN